MSVRKPKWVRRRNKGGTYWSLFPHVIRPQGKRYALHTWRGEKLGVYRTLREAKRAATKSMRRLSP